VDKRINIILTDELYDAVRRYSFESHISIAAIVRLALIDYFKKVGN
jgi:hypothetical protein